MIQNIFIGIRSTFLFEGEGERDEEGERRGEMWTNRMKFRRNEIGRNSNVSIAVRRRIGGKVFFVMVDQHFQDDRSVGVIHRERRRVRLLDLLVFGEEKRVADADGQIVRRHAILRRMLNDTAEKSN